MKSSRYLNMLGIGFALALSVCTTVLLTGCSDSDPSEEGGKEVVNRNANTAVGDRAVQRLEFPALTKTGRQQVIVHRLPDAAYDKDSVNFCTEWDCERKSQRWSCYQLHKGFTGSYSRVTSSYPQDPAIAKADRYTDVIYGSGFEHGHICPNADRGFSHDANYQTFYMSNMQPQYHEFNGFDSKNSSRKGLWLRMEQRLNSWAKSLSDKDTIFVCKGGTIDDEKNIIKRIDNKLIVPRYFFMAILRKSQFGYTAMGFWSEQTSDYRTGETLLSHAMSIDELEKLTGIDFFCNLPDDIEDSVEKTFNAASWNGL